MRRFRSVAMATATVVIALVAIGAFLLGTSRGRAVAVRFGLQAVAWQRGMHVQSSHISVGHRTIDIDGLRVTDSHGELFLAIRHVRATLDFAGLLGRSDRQLGLSDIFVDHPQLNLIRHDDGSWNFETFMRGAGPSGPPPGAAAAPPAVTPWRLHARIMDGSVLVLDPQAVVAYGRTMAIGDVAAEFWLDQGAQSTGSIRAVLRTAQGASPLSGTLHEDDRIALGMFALHAHAVPIAPIVDGFAPQKSFVMERGLADVEMRAYSVGYGLGASHAWHLSGDGLVHGAQIRVLPLIAPVRDLGGRVYYHDGLLSTSGFDGVCGGVPLHGFGAIQLLGGIRIAFGAQQRGSLERERRMFAFSHDKPVSGPFAAAIRVDGSPDDIHIAGAFEANDAVYGGASIHSLRGLLYYAAGHVTVNAFDLATGGARAWADGDFDVGAPIVQTMLSFQARAPSSAVPVAANIEPTATVATLAVLVGPVSHLGGAGYAQLRGGKRATLRTFYLGDASRLSVGPLEYRSGAGNIWGGATMLRQPGARSYSGELIATNVRIKITSGRVTLADLPAISASLPSLDTALNGVAIIDAREGSPDVALDARASNLNLAGVSFGQLAISAFGRNGHVHIVQASANGEDVRARAQGDLVLTPSLKVSAATLRGRATAKADALADILHGLRTRGSTSGEFSVAMFGSGYLASADLFSSDAAINGVQLRRGAALVTSSGATTSLFANVAAAGTTVSTAGTITNAGSRPVAQMVAFAPLVDLRNVRELGIPLTTGSATGFVSMSGPFADPSIVASAVVRSTYDRAPIAGDIDLRYRNATLGLHATRVAYLGNRVTIDGSASGIGRASAPSNLSFDVRVKNGDLAGLNRLTGKAAPLTGSYDSLVRVSGSARSPSVDGAISTNVGTLRGVAFEHLQGRMHATPSQFALRRASVTLGSSSFGFDGDLAARVFNVRVTSPHVDLSDFNDFYGGADVFAGTGNFDMAVHSRNGRLAWSGDFDLSDAALRNFPLGFVSADFSSGSGLLRAVAIQNGSIGASTITGSASFRPTKSGFPDPRTANYHIAATVRNVDLAAVMPAIHQGNLGLTGTLEAQGQLSGSLHNPVGAATVSLQHGHLRRMPINLFDAAVRSDATAVTLLRGNLQVPYMTATATGRYIFATGHMAAQAELRADDLTKVSTALRVPGALAGSATASLDASGTTRRPIIAANIDAGRAKIYSIAFDSAKLHATYTPGSLSIGKTALEFSGGRGAVRIEGELPLQLQPFALGPKDHRIDLSMVAEKVDLSTFDPIATRFGTMAGNLNVAAAISGTAGNPIGRGSAQIRFASVHSPFDAVPLTNVGADIVFNRDTITMRTLSANKGTGTVAFNGEAHIVPAAGLRSNAGLQYWTHVSMRRAQLDVPGWVRGTVDGDVSLTKSGVIPYLEGEVAASDAVIPFSAIYDLATGGTAAKAQPQAPPGVPPLKNGHTIVYGGGIYGDQVHTMTTMVKAGPTPMPTGFELPSLDVKLAVTAGNNVRVRGGDAIDLTAAGGVVIAGNLRAPTLDGQFIAVRGQVGYFDTNFRLVSGSVTFDPTAGLLPTMDVVAVTNTSGAEITLHITGRVDNLNTELSSNPEMSRDQIVATLLHAPQLAALTSSGSTPGQAQTTLTQTAQSYFTAQLSRSLLYPFESALAQQLNVESVSFIFDPQGNLALELRKRVSPTISAVYQTTLRVPVTQSYGVSYRLRDYLSLDLIQAQPNLAITLPQSSYATTTLNLRYQFH